VIDRVATLEKLIWVTIKLVVANTTMAIPAIPAIMS